MNSVNIFKNTKFISRIFYPRYHTLCSNVKHYSVDTRCKIVRSSYLNVLLKPENCISNYSIIQTKDSHSASDKNDNEKIQKILEDQEFQSILKDFANDFGVDSETNELLEDIRKNINGDYKESNLSTEKLNSSNDTSTGTLGGGLDHKYKEFSDADSTIIHSYENHNDAFEDEQIYHIDQELKPRSPYNNVKRGVTGVFDIDDMIQVLRNESLLDIAAISMLTDGKDCSCDFFILVTAKSQRHCDAVSESIKKLYKIRKNESDPFITVEGASNSGWRVIDMGNIVLHIFLEETRAKYDIESCQLLDHTFDSGGNVEIDPMLNIIEEQLEFFNSLQQSNSSKVSNDIS